MDASLLFVIGVENGPSQLVITYLKDNLFNGEFELPPPQGYYTYMTYYIICLYSFYAIIFKLIPTFFL